MIKIGIADIHTFFAGSYKICRLYTRTMAGILETLTEIPEEHEVVRRVEIPCGVLLPYDE